MSHEKGIEESVKEIVSFYDGEGRSFEDMAFSVIKAYLNASGMVMVPREPTDDMCRVLWHQIDVVANDAVGVWEAMVESYTNPFQTPEESREKK